MMLDSTSSKILTDKQVRLPLQNETDKSEEKAVDRLTTSEAEIRIVFKLIVEEQLVYEGKVKRVNQLENEEITRVVSRVAWDGAKEADKPITVSESDGANKETSVEHKKPDQHRIVPPDNPPDESTNSQAENASSPPDRTTEEVQEESFLEVETLDHMAYVKSTVDTPQSEASKIGDSLVAQVERLPDAESTRKIDCDITLEQTLNHICQVDQRNSPKSPQVQESNELDLKEEVVISNEAENVVDSIQEPILESSESLEDPLGDSKSISETLNDCVNNVDLASRQEALETVAAQTQKEESLNSPTTPLVLNSSKDSKETCKDISNTNVNVMKTKISAVDIEQNRDHKVASITKDYLTEDTIASHQAKSKENPSVRLKSQPRDDIGGPSNKRKASGDPKSLNKRVRKAAPKERRNSNTRTGANKNLENASTILQGASMGAKSSDAVSLLVNNQHARQNKIFAKWSDNHFYPGTIIKMAKDRKFVIAFFDGAQRNVAETDLIPLGNIEGKQVRVSIAKNYCVNAIVHNQRSPVNEQPMFNVEYQQDGLVQKCVPLKDIFLTGEQGMSLISQADRSNGASNFADVDLDNIIFEKRSRRLQEMEDFELTENPSTNSRRKRAQYNMRNITPRVKSSSADGLNNPVSQTHKRQPHSDFNQDPESAESPDVLKSNFLCPNSNPPSEGSSSTGSSNVPNTLDLGQEFYFSNSPHRTKTSLLL